MVRKNNGIIDCNVLKVLVISSFFSRNEMVPVMSNDNVKTFQLKLLTLLSHIFSENAEKKNPTLHYLP